jgi:hypothetical protein
MAELPGPLTNRLRLQEIISGRFPFHTVEAQADRMVVISEHGNAAHLRFRAPETFTPPEVNPQLMTFGSRLKTLTLFQQR